ncbi:MAG: hypothetical protein ACK5U4_22355, partial [Rhodospirillales bacterium]
RYVVFWASSGVPFQTDYLNQPGPRKPGQVKDATDKRRSYIVLSKNARDQLDQLLDSMLEDPSS